MSSIHSLVMRATGTVTTGEHNVAGVFTIAGDCTFSLQSFTYDGLAPDTHVLIGAAVNT